MVVVVDGWMDGALGTVLDSATDGAGGGQARELLLGKQSRAEQCRAVQSSTVQFFFSSSSVINARVAQRVKY